MTSNESIRLRRIVKQRRKPIINTTLTAKSFPVNLNPRQMRLISNKPPGQGEVVSDLAIA